MTYIVDNEKEYPSMTSNLYRTICRRVEEVVGSPPSDEAEARQFVLTYGEQINVLQVEGGSCALR